MLVIGDIYLYVDDFDKALRFWADGLKLEVSEKDSDEHSTFARLDFPEGGPSLILIAEREFTETDAQTDENAPPRVSFDIATSDFDATLVQLLDQGGQQLSEIETYHDLKMVTLADLEGYCFDLVEIPVEIE